MVKERPVRQKHVRGEHAGEAVAVAPRHVKALEGTVERAVLEVQELVVAIVAEPGASLKGKSGTVRAEN